MLRNQMCAACQNKPFVINQKAGLRLVYGNSGMDITLIKMFWLQYKNKNVIVLKQYIYFV